MLRGTSYNDAGTPDLHIHFVILIFAICFRMFQALCQDDELKLKFIVEGMQKASLMDANKNEMCQSLKQVELFPFVASYQHCPCAFVRL